MHVLSCTVLYRIALYCTAMYYLIMSVSCRMYITVNVNVNVKVEVEVEVEVEVKVKVKVKVEG